MAGCRDKQVFGVAAVRSQARPARAIAQLFLAAQAEAAMPASPPAVDHHRVSLRQALGSLPEPGHPAGVLMPHNQRDTVRRHAPVLLMQIGVTHSRGGDLDQHLPWPWMRGGHLLDTQRLPDGVQYRSPHLVLLDTGLV